VLDPGALPRTSSGKIRRQTTAHRHLLGELNPPLPVTKLGLIKVIAASLGAIFHLNRSRPE
jgi:hypothetical protein